MFIFNYAIPFACTLPDQNPWDGLASVEVCFEASGGFSQEDGATLQNHLFPFWLLASGGALAGDAIPPEHSTAEQPTFRLTQTTAFFSFEPALLDERATACLLCLVLGAHEEVSFDRVRIGAGTQRQVTLQSDPSLDDPFPPLPRRVPFPFTIEDSESDVREVFITWSQPLTNEAAEEVTAELQSFGAALLAGAYGVSPSSPSACGCMPEEDINHDTNKSTWVLSNCRFHYAALEALIALCASISVCIAPIAEVIVE